ncbi:MAG: GTP cyclohydrolase I FolE [Bacteroidetes bacterium]|nr:MAG: GTP cyclohydrolase I FolE [Bacteroidota bacterium]
MTKIKGYRRVDEFDDETTQKLAFHYKEILGLLGEDSNREGLLETPVRVAKAMQFMTQGYHANAKEIIQSAVFTEDYKQMVIVKDIELYSMCEHHMIPFIGKAHVAYIPNGRVMGLSKVARVVEVFARRLQIQERLTMQIKDAIDDAINPLGVAVVIEAKHLCMAMRGIEKQSSVTTTSDFTGAFLNDPKTRDEFLRLISTKLS